MFENSDGRDDKTDDKEEKPDIENGITKTGLNPSGQNALQENISFSRNKTSNQHTVDIAFPLANGEYDTVQPKDVFKSKTPQSKTPQVQEKADEKEQEDDCTKYHLRDLKFCRPP